MLYKILYATIKNYELEERLRRDDYVFDAFEFLSKKIGYKNSSTLRKMCEPRNNGTNVAKIGVEDVLVIMSITRDYRIAEFIREDLKQRQQQTDGQFNLLFQPLRKL